jgi:hypothetical protein
MTMGLLEEFSKDFVDFLWSIHINPLLAILALMGLLTYSCRNYFYNWLDLDFSTKIFLVLLLFSDFVILIGTVAYFAEEY